MRSLKRLIIALLSFLLLYLIASLADISLHVWAVTPFSIPEGEKIDRAVHTVAVGKNNLLMCPIQVEE